MRHLRCRLTRAAIGLALVGLGPAVAAAQQWWWPPSLAVEPPAPTTDDPLTITLSGEWPDSCIPNGSSVSPPPGSVIDFAVVWDYPPDIACLTVITPWERSETLGPLPAGSYEVRATLYDGFTGLPITKPTHVGGFTVTPATRPGDTNCDGRIDFADIDPFVTSLVGRARYEARYPTCRWLNGDIDGNGSVDFDDISPFVACLVNGGCP